MYYLLRYSCSHLFSRHLLEVFVKFWSVRFRISRKFPRNVFTVLHLQWHVLQAQIFNHTMVCYPSRKYFNNGLKMALFNQYVLVVFRVQNNPELLKYKWHQIKTFFLVSAFSSGLLWKLSNLARGCLPMPSNRVYPRKY